MDPLQVCSEAHDLQIKTLQHLASEKQTLTEWLTQGLIQPIWSVDRQTQADLLKMLWPCDKLKGSNWYLGAQNNWTPNNQKIVLEYRNQQALEFLKSDKGLQSYYSFSMKHKIFLHFCFLALRNMFYI